MKRLAMIAFRGRLVGAGFPADFRSAVRDAAVPLDCELEIYVSRIPRARLAA